MYPYIDQNTNQVLGQGDTYSQAETIANDLVATRGGRYKIKREEYTRLNDDEFSVLVSDGEVKVKNH